MKSTFRKHTSKTQLARVMIGAFILVFITLPIFRTGEYVFERWLAPQDYWFEYTSIKPIHAEFKRGETIEFNSIIEYKKNITIQWFDYLVCEEDGVQRKLRTQVWPEYGPAPKSPGFVGLPTIGPEGVKSLPSWAYTAEPIADNATYCYLHANAVGYTPRYHEPKSYVYISPWFPVNK